MSNGKYSAVFEGVAERLLDQVVGFQVNSGSSFIQDQNLGFS